MTDAIEATTDQRKLEYVTEARRLLALFQDPIWGATAAQTDEEHLADYKSTLAKTREYYPELPEKTEIHAVMGEGNVVFAFTGNAPNSGERARALVGFIHTMPYLLDSLVELIELKRTHSDRVSELIQHNTMQLMENRAQRDTILKLQAQVQFLMDQIPGAQVMA
ncbi:hypothetical protein I6F34_01630 [Bradyrhizobium sp. BRP05]|nr:hypothetical protein [Bradyrhizobium sp. BRP05]